MSGLTRPDSGKPPHILIADDHPIVREALGVLFRRAGFEVSDEVGTLAGLREALGRSPPPDLLLLDLDMPGMKGLDSVAELRRENAGLRIAIISASTDENVARAAVAQGASGFVPKGFAPAAVLAAVNLILAGVTYLPPAPEPQEGEEGEAANAAGAARASGVALTPRELEILRRLVAGLPNKAIANELDLAEVTVKLHVRRVLKKLGVRNRAAAVTAAIRAKLVRVP
jgi:two-component system, NarL family, nitrate/nitrite response regulator NarL